MSGHDWGYTKDDGPDTWLTFAKAGLGPRQSPIDIVPGKCTYDASLAANPLRMSYLPKNALKLFNNGHSAQVNYTSEGSSLTGGPLSHKYELEQFHLHWGKTSTTGSEHTICGKAFAAELHLVHWNTGLFKTFGDAAQKDQGLCVLGIFLKEGKEHPGFKQMSDQLSKVLYKDDSVNLTSGSGIDPAQLLPGNTTEYWTYPGSLTTPPLFESVTWVVFKEPIEVSTEQLTSLRNLHQHKKGESVSNEFKGHIVENYRPPLPVGDRTVRASKQGM